MTEVLDLVACDRNKNNSEIVGFGMDISNKKLANKL